MNSKGEKVNAHAGMSVSCPHTKGSGPEAGLKGRGVGDWRENPWAAPPAVVLSKREQMPGHQVISLFYEVGSGACPGLKASRNYMALHKFHMELNVCIFIVSSLGPNEAGTSQECRCFDVQVSRPDDTRGLARLPA